MQIDRRGDTCYNNSDHVSEVSKLECKTIIEELMEQPSAERERENRLDSAYKLLSSGNWNAANDIFDDVLLEDPGNERALTGKRVINRELHVARRISRYNERLGRAQPMNIPRRQPLLLRSKKAQAALIACFVLFCSAAGALLMFSPEPPRAVISEKPSFFEQYGISNHSSPD